MALVDLVEAAEDPTAPVVEVLTWQDVTAKVAALEADLAAAQESLADAALAFDDRGWLALDRQVADEMSREGLRRVARVARAMVVTNPLMRRGVNLGICYVWGQGVTVTARAPEGDDTGQDVNAVVQAFLDDPSNQASFTTAQPREELERELKASGNVFLALFTNPTTGRVQVRSVSFDEIDDVITNPEDRDDPWYYRRSWTVTAVTPGVDPRTGAPSGGVTATEQRTAFYPALGYRPGTRPRLIDGHPVVWDAPVLHVSVNRLDGWKFGVGDAYPAIFWARGYKEFLEDWARLVRALSRFAWRVGVRNAKGGAAARDRLAAVPAAAVDGSSLAGGAATLGPDQTLEAIPKSGATIDSNSGRPLAAMVAAAFDVPVTMLLCDPGQEGARAVAETLDQPTRLAAEMRRDRWATTLRLVLRHVIEQAVKAPQGPLRGTRRIDPYTGLETVELAGGQDSTVDVVFPPLVEQDPVARVGAIVSADDTGRLPAETVARLLLEALGVEDVDELLDGMRDDAGEFVAPGVSAGQAAADAFNRGEDPAGLLNPGGGE